MKSMIARYAELEMEIHALVSARLGDEAKKGRVALKLLAAAPRCLRATTQRAILGRIVD